MGVKVVNADEGIAIRVGEPKKQLRIALPDCRVIATSVLAKATPVFSKLEEWMKPLMSELRQLSVRLLRAGDHTILADRLPNHAYSLASTSISPA